MNRAASYNFNLTAIIVSLLFSVLLLDSCFTVRKTKTRVEGEKVPVNNVLTKISQPDFNYSWFSAKAKIDIDDAKNRNTVNASIRMRRDSAIWVSLASTIGLEVSRILITPDSVKLLDKLNRRYYIKSFDYVKELTHQPNLDFRMLQKIIIGNDANINLKNALIENQDSVYKIQTTENQIQSIIWVNAINFTLAKKQLSEKVINQSYEMSYGDYRLLADRLFSYKRKLKLAAKDNYTLDVDYQKITLDEPVKMPFNVPEKYDVVR